MSELPQISKAEFEVIKIIWKYVPMGILKEYMKKGFALDDDRLKRLGGGNYFDELPARIRDTSSSEKVFWRKVLVHLHIGKRQRRFATQITVF